MAGPRPLEREHAALVENSAGQENGFCCCLCVPTGSHACNDPEAGQNCGRSELQSHAGGKDTAAAKIGGVGAARVLARPSIFPRLCTGDPQTGAGDPLWVSHIKSKRPK